MLGAACSSVSAADFFTSDGSGTLNNRMPIRGTGANASVSWGGNMITNFDHGATPISTPTASQEAYFDNSTGTFTGFLILESLCMTADCTDGSGHWDDSAFMVLGHGVAGSEPKLVSTADNNIYTFT